MSQPLTYTVTQEEFAERCSDVAQEIGHPVVGNEGTIQHFGAAVGYAYNPETSQLTLTILKHPFGFSDGYVARKIDAWFKPHQG